MKTLFEFFKDEQWMNRQVQVIKEYRENQNKPKETEGSRMYNVLDMIKDIHHHIYSLNVQDENGDTPLHLAVQKEGLEELVVALVNNGAEVTTRNHKNKKPVDVAVSKQTKKALKSFEKEQLSRKAQVRSHIKKYMRARSMKINQRRFLRKKFPPTQMQMNNIILSQSLCPGRTRD